jgi:hypothetical protein
MSIKTLYIHQGIRKLIDSEDLINGQKDREKSQIN